jgi:hypothetical protein
VRQRGVPPWASVLMSPGRAASHAQAGGGKVVGQDEAPMPIARTCADRGDQYWRVGRVVTRSRWGREIPKTVPIPNTLQKAADVPVARCPFAYCEQVPVP